MKVLATTLEETAGDYLSMTLNLGYYAGFAITFAALLVILWFQITTKRYNPARHRKLNGMGNLMCDDGR